MRLIAKLLLLSLVACLLTTIFTHANAQSSWPPAPTNSGDDPYRTGTFHSGGYTFHITFLSVSGTYYYTRTNNSGTTSGTVPFTAGTTNMGAASLLWRVANLSDGGKGGGGIGYTFLDSGDPIFTFKITVDKPFPSNDFTVSIRIATGATNCRCESRGAADMHGSLASAQATGEYADGITLSTQSTDNNDDSKGVTNARSSDHFQSARIVNGTATFIYNVPVNISGNFSFAPLAPGQSEIARAQADCEIVPIEVIYKP